MIYLYTLPGVSFNYPVIHNPLIKGYFLNNNIQTKHIDLSNIFLQKCINFDYIKSNFNQSYKQLNENEQNIVKTIDKSIKVLKSKTALSEEIIEASFCFTKTLNFIASNYDIGWSGREINFPKKLEKSMKCLILLTRTKTHYLIQFLIMNLAKAMKI